MDFRQLSVGSAPNAAVSRRITYFCTGFFDRRSPDLLLRPTELLLVSEYCVVWIGMGFKRPAIMYDLLFNIDFFFLACCLYTRQCGRTSVVPGLDFRIAFIKLTRGFFFFSVTGFLNTSYLWQLSPYLYSNNVLCMLRPHIILLLSIQDRLISPCRFQTFPFLSFLHSLIFW